MCSSDLSEERLLKAAEEIFSKHGFKGATTRMIAQKAKVNESLIGRYFDGKMGLLFSLIEKHIEEIPLEQLPYAPQETTREELTSFVLAMYNKHCLKDVEFFKIVLSQCLVDQKFLKRIRETVPMKVHPQLAERLANLQTKGKIAKSVNLELFINSLDTCFHGVMLFDKLLLGDDDNKLRETLLFIVNSYSCLAEGK